jgi:hypothetical protein
MSEKEENKTTTEKPVSLFPLKFKEALSAFMNVKPATKEEMDKAIKEKEKKEKKPGLIAGLFLLCNIFSSHHFFEN